MKILFTNFHEYGGGGHDAYITGLCAGLSEEHDITVAAAATSSLLQKTSLLAGVKTVPIVFKIRLNKLNQLVYTVRKLRRLLRAEQYDIVHVNGSADHTLVILAGVGMKVKPRVVFTKHNSLPIKWGAMLRYRYFTDVIIAVSQATKDMFPGSLTTPIVVVRHGVDTEHFKPMDKAQSLTLRQQHGIAADAIVFGSVAGTPFYKGWWLLLEAVSQIQPMLPASTKIMIVGDPLSDEMKQQYIDDKGLKDKVILTGWVNDVREVIPLFDIGFVLSYAVETLSFACRQMMAMGKPVIVSNYCGFPENITPEIDGWITEAQSVDSIKTCLLNILANRDKLPLMSTKAREKAVAEFGYKQWVAETKKVYSDHI